MSSTTPKARRSVPGTVKAQRRRLGVRARSVLVAVGVVLIAMLIGGAGLVYVLEDNVETTATATANARAQEVSDLIASTGLSEATATILAEGRSGQLVQIIGPDGTVYGASNRDIATAPLAKLRPTAGEVAVTEGSGFLGEPGEWAIVARGVSARNRTYVVQVAIPIAAQQAMIRSISVYLLVVTPLLLAVVALAVWLLLGRALHAVEGIRREVAGIDSRHLATRVEVPPTRDEIAALAETMNTMLDRLDRADVAQRAFVSDASHELRSPLATLTTAAELAQTANEPRRGRLMATIMLELVRIRGLVENLMTLARADAASADLATGDVDLDDLIDLERQRLQATGGCTVVAAVEPVRIDGDYHRLEQAFRNVVDNAERHARSTVRLTVTRSQDTAVVWIDNDGPAIATADRERIFERFVRLDESRSRDIGGSGLGLAIARSTVEAHRGRLAVVDAPDGWCRFEAQLPVQMCEP